MDVILTTLMSHTTVAQAVYYYGFADEAMKYTMSHRVMNIVFFYFIIDSLCVFYLQKHYGYLIHHTCSLYICYNGIVHNIDPKILTNYFVVLEISNMFLTFRNLKRLRALVYIPFRTLALPIVTRDIFVDSWSRGYYSLCTCYICLLFISYFYAYKLFVRLH